MNTSICLICPFFGTVNKTIHSLWLQGCAANPDITFLLLTDDAEALKVCMPENVKGIYMGWDDCVALLRSKFEFEITLNDPYKLCDFKPAYGYIFSEQLKGFGFWGHVDSSDTIMGNLRKFVSDEMMETYDKIHSFGHFTLYRNTPEINLRFQIPPTCGITIQELFSRAEVTGFDEMNHPWSINTIYKENGFSLLERIPDLVADIFPSRYAFQIVEDCGEKIPRVFEWDHGRLFDVTVCDEVLQRREIGYVHFQKRKMVNEVMNGEEHFYMIPNRFIPASDPLTCGMIKNWSKNKLYLDPLKGRVNRIFNYAKHPDVFLRKVRGKLS